MDPPPVSQQTKAAPANLNLGFSLPELMVVLAIIAIFIAVGLPSYDRYRDRSMRSLAVSALLECAMAAEQEAGLHFSYAGLDADADQVPDLGACPDEVHYAGIPIYRLQVIAASFEAYRLQAVPLAASPVADTGLLEINQSGGQYWDRDNDGQFQGSAEMSWAALQ